MPYRVRYPEGSMAKITEQDIASIRSTINPWTQACLDRDWDALFKLCTQDLVLLPPEAPAAEGHEAARAFLDEFPIMKAFTFVSMALQEQRTQSGSKSVVNRTSGRLMPSTPTAY